MHEFSGELIVLKARARDPRFFCFLSMLSNMPLQNFKRVQKTLLTAEQDDAEAVQDMASRFT